MKTLQETWRPVIGYEGYYEISDLGRIRSLPRVVRGRNNSTRQLKRRYLRTDKGPNGRVTVGLWKNNSSRTRYLHQLVLEAFVGPCPKGKEACHFPDRNTENNRLSNLRWGTCQENHNDRKKHGTTMKGEECPTAKLTTEQVEAIKKTLIKKAHVCGINTRLGEKYGVSQSTISEIRHGKLWSHVRV